MPRAPVSSHPHQHLLFSFFFPITTLVGMKQYLLAILICIFLITNDVEHIFLCHLLIFFVKMSIQILCPVEPSRDWESKGCLLRAGWARGRPSSLWLAETQRQAEEWVSFPVGKRGLGVPDGAGGLVGGRGYQKREASQVTIQGAGWTFWGWSWVGSRTTIREAISIDWVLANCPGVAVWLPGLSLETAVCPPACLTPTRLAPGAGGCGLRVRALLSQVVWSSSSCMCRLSVHFLIGLFVIFGESQGFFMYSAY